MTDKEILNKANNFGEKEYFTDSYEIERISFGFFHGAKWTIENIANKLKSEILPKYLKESDINDIINEINIKS